MIRSTRRFHAAMSLLVCGIFKPPVHAEAGIPWITIQVTGVGAPTNIPLGISSCTAADRTTDYPLNIHQTTGDDYAGAMVHNAPNAIAQHLIAGKTGAGDGRRLQEAKWHFAKQVFSPGRSL